MTTSALQVRAFTLSDAQFVVIRDLVHRVSGISLSDGKKDLVRSRLNKRLRTLGLADYDEYIGLLQDDRDGAELTVLIDSISTNVTHFFREPDHFHHLGALVAARAAEAGGGRRLRIWSAGCSSGEEPYTIAVTVAEALGRTGGWDVRVLATDISTNVLARAQRGVYAASALQAVDDALRDRHFDAVRSGGETVYRVKPALRRLVTFARLNLMGDWPMRGPFDAIFCRNVMIYFDKPTQAALVNRYWQLLAPRGRLYIGHSENLRGFEHRFVIEQPTVYRRAQ